jgi:arylsulfatase A-like enzyme
LTPLVTSVEVVPEERGATIDVTVSEGATFWIEHGPTSAYGSRTVGTTDGALSATLTGYPPDSDVHFRVVGTDARGVPFEDGDRTFHTTYRWNVVIVMTDDQRFDMQWAMPIVTERLAERGAVFERAYASTPLCCPSRVSMYSGARSRNSNVLGNFAPNGGFTRFNDANTLPVLLQRAGYRTGFIAKYVNDYADEGAGEVPPGWTSFQASVELGLDWASATWVDGSSGPDARGPMSPIFYEAGYLTDVTFAKAVSFIEQSGDEPFYLLVHPTSPHDPSYPAKEDKGLFLDYVLRRPNYLEEDRSDKPEYIRGLEPLDDEDLAKLDEGVVLTLQCLQSIDRGVGSVLDALDAAGVAHRTMVVFLSDNGYAFGEHGAQGKGLAYEESAKVPLIMYLPGAEPQTVDALSVATLDVPATVMSLTGLEGRTDGRDLLPLLRGEPWERPTEIVLEAWASTATTWASLITDDGFKLIRHETLETELYDLAADPYEMTSLHADPKYADVVADLLARLEPQQSAMLTTQEIVLSVGQPAKVSLTAVGGIPPYSYVVVDKALPAGLSLSPDGVLSGVPTDSSTATYSIEVTDGTVGWQSGVPFSTFEGVLIRTTDRASLVGAATSAFAGDAVTMWLPLDRPAEGRLWWSRGRWLDVTEGHATPWSTFTPGAPIHLDGLPEGPVSVGVELEGKIVARFSRP